MPETGILARLRDSMSRAVEWPPLEDEIGADRALLRGRVLNVGAGHRDLSPLVDGELFNQDLPDGLHNANIHIESPLDRIPKEDGFFDVVFCNAVLEHVEDPEAVVREFFRVLRPGGTLYLCVPFMQPEHLDPRDYQRYARDGLRALALRHGFLPERVESVHNVWLTIGRIVQAWLNSKTTPSYRLARLILYPILRWRCRRSKTRVEECASAYKLIARKPASPPQVAPPRGETAARG